MTEIEVTPAVEFRTMREQGVRQTLPSGRVVRLRTVTPDRLLALGDIPDILTSLVLRMIYGELQQNELDSFLSPREKAAEARQVIASLNVVCRAALLYPTVVEADPQGDDEILPDDLTLAERGWIFKLAFQPAEVLTRFRYESTPDVEVVPDGKDDPQPAE